MVVIDEIKNLWKAISWPVKGFMLFVLACVIVGAMIWWGAPVRNSDVKDMNAIKDAIEQVDSSKVTFIKITESVNDVRKDGKMITCQPVFYKVEKDSVQKVIFVKTKKGFMKYHFDSLMK